MAANFFFSSGPEIFQAKGDGTDPQKLTTVGNQVFNLRLAPDNKRLRMDVVDNRNGSSTIWELGRDGRGLHPLLPA
jgi:hypothetical protein